MSVASELAANRRVTHAYIIAKPMLVVLMTDVRTKTPAGGIKRGDGFARVAQVMRLIEQASAYGNQPGLLRAADGAQRRVTFQLLGEWDAEMEVGDHWSDSLGVRLEVAELLPYNGYERRGRVVSYG